MGKNTNIILLSGLLVACSTADQPQEEPNENLLSEALSYVQPESLVSMEQTIRSKISNIACLEYKSDGISEKWTANCSGFTGITAEGSLTLKPELSLQAEHFVILQEGQPVFYFDGSMEFIEHKELLQLNFAGFMCGLQENNCSEGYVHLDMVASIYPITDYPQNYDISVQGVFNGEENLSFEGSWKVDRTQCSTEPTHGVFGVQNDQRHELTIAEGSNCDGCAGWTFQGEAIGDFCHDSMLIQ